MPDAKAHKAVTAMEASNAAAVAARTTLTGK